MLLQENAQYNLTSITDPDEIAVRHFDDSLTAVPLMLEAANVCQDRPSLIDVGSGGGFPGLALAIGLPDWRVVSVEATGKKVQFQQLIADELSLDNVKIINARAEKLAHFNDYRESFTVATARALGPLVRLVELVLPFVAIGGKLLAWKGPRADEELPQAEWAIKKLGGRLEKQHRYELETIKDSDFRIVVIEKIKKTPPQYPRDYKDIKAKPLS